MAEGWIKLNRKFLEWEWFEDPAMVKLFLFLLLKANYKDKRWKGIEVKRGQLVTTLRDMVKQAGISMQKLRTCLAKLQETQEINTQTTHQFTIITVCKYDSYQSQEDDGNTQSTHEQHTSNTRVTQTKERKNNIYYINSSTSTVRPHAREDEHGSPDTDGTPTDGHPACRDDTPVRLPSGETPDENTPDDETTNETPPPQTTTTDETTPLDTEIHEMRGKQQWREIVCMNYRLTPEQLDERFSGFRDWCLLNDQTAHPGGTPDAVRHFISWMNANVNRQQQNPKANGQQNYQRGTATNPQTDAQRRMQDYAQVAATFRRQADASQVARPPEPDEYVPY